MAQFFKAVKVTLDNLHSAPFEAVVKLTGNTFTVYTLANGKSFKAESDMLIRDEESLGYAGAYILESECFSYMHIPACKECNATNSFATFQPIETGKVRSFISYDCEPCSEEDFKKFLSA